MLLNSIIITGANGMLGSTLCIKYHDSYQINALHRDLKCLAPCRGDFSLDLNSLPELTKIFDSIKPNLVIHCAGNINMELCEKYPELAYAANAKCTENIAQLCGDKIKLVYISTDQVYGNDINHSEYNSNLLPINQYGKTKFIGENLAMEYSKDCIIIRTNIFGWNVKPGRVSSAEWMYHSLKNDKPITLFTDYTFSPIYTKILGEIILQLVKNDFSGVINVGSSEPCTKYEFGIHLAQKFKYDLSLINQGSVEEHSSMVKRAKDLTMDTDKITELDIAVPAFSRSIESFSQDCPYN